jgi:uncharacterized protein
LGNNFKKNKGALPVAPSDLENSIYTFAVIHLAAFPLHKINFKTIVVASEDDEWVLIKRAKFLLISEEVTL